MEESWLQQQMDEFACMQSMFPDAHELVFDQQLYDQHMNALLDGHAQTAATLKRFQYTLQLPVLQRVNGYQCNLPTDTAV